MNENAKVIKDYLEASYSGAKMMDDVECMARISRALAAFESEIDGNIFTEEFLEEYYSKV